MNLLLTGGSGFVGINIAEQFLDKGVDVTIYDLSYPVHEAIESLSSRKGKFKFVQGDVLDLEKMRTVFQAGEFNAIIHAAVITSTAQTEKTNPKKIFEINCIGTINLLDEAVRSGVSRFIYVSSIAVLGRTAQQVNIVKEDTPDLQPNNFYEITKFTSEKIALRYKRLHELNLTITRLGDVFGPWEMPTAVRQLMSAPFQTLKFALNAEKAYLPRPNRTSWVYSRDVAAALFAVTNRADLQNDIFNISGEAIWSIEDWCRRLKYDFPDFNYLVTSNPNLWNIRYHAELDNAPMSVELLKKEVDYQPKYNLEKSAVDYIDWASQCTHVFN